MRRVKPCGTNAAYGRGCRCDECREAHAKYAASRRRTGTARKHGTVSGYINSGCRCEACKRAGAAWNAEQHPRRQRKRSLSDEYRSASNARSKRYHAETQAETLEKANRHYQQWTGPELELASRTDLSNRAVALLIGRSAAAVRNMRAKLAIDPRKIKAAGVPKALT